MTALRPERESGAAHRGAAPPGSPYGQQPHGGSGVWQQGQQWSGNDPYPADSGGAGHAGQPYGQLPRPRQPQQQPSYDATAAVSYDAGYGGYGEYNDYSEYGAHGGASYREPGLVDNETVALRVPDVEEARQAPLGTDSTPGGRAARRKAARKHGGRRGNAPQTAEKPAGRAQEAPRSRIEARRAARARKPSAGVLVSRVIGELFITTGVVMLLFVTYQLWWSNVRAHAEAGSAARHLQQDWASGKRAPGVFAPGQGFAILHIPKLDVVAPIAEGTSKTQVLDKGMVGHYGEGRLKTAMPDARTGNFGLAAHRNTHGEPFRYINLLKPGDSIVVETQDEYYVYKMTSSLPVTSPSNTKVLDPIPQGSGFTKPGRYITLTTCTPEFTSKYRLIVWGKMVEERPRSKGKPDALL